VRRFCEIAKDSDGTLRQRLPLALSGANDAVAKAAILDGTLEGAGCAFLSAAIDGTALSWISAGDCSLLLFRRGKLRKLNEDHSMRPVLAGMVAAGRLSKREAAQDPRRHSLRSALKGSEIRLVDNSSDPVRLQLGDCVILASDGFDTLSLRAVTKVLRRGRAESSAGTVERLFEAIRATRARNQDNATVIFYRFAPIDGDAQENPGSSRWHGLLWIVLTAAMLFAVVYGLICQPVEQLTP
jgi:serine/threonine protein phosphatase PrpC